MTTLSTKPATGLVLKCPVIGLFVSVSVPNTQPKSALALASGLHLAVALAQDRKQAGHEAPQLEGELRASPSMQKFRAGTEQRNEYKPCGGNHGPTVHAPKM